MTDTDKYIRGKSGYSKADEADADSYANLANLSNTAKGYQNVDKAVYLDRAKTSAGRKDNDSNAKYYGENVVSKKFSKGGAVRGWGKARSPKTTKNY